MDWKLFLQLITTASVAVFATWAAHHFSAKRDAENERRKLRLQYMLEAYRIIEGYESREDGPERWRMLERAAADIQLLGTPRQIKCVQDWMVEFTSTQSGLLNPMLNELRNSLRKEMSLAPAPGPLMFLRIKPKRASDNT